VLRLTAESAPMDGAVYRDADGRRQMLCGVWRAAALRRAIDHVCATRGTVEGASAREMFEPLNVAEVSWRRPGPPPWFDCDTDDDLRTAEEWVR
jgi:molybdopterin-guanine dinucleotide biosynthesis protein A